MMWLHLASEHFSSVQNARWPYQVKVAKLVSKERRKMLVRAKFGSHGYQTKQVNAALCQCQCKEQLNHVFHYIQCYCSWWLVLATAY
uniref:Uncharacterized protein n=1 Tax=Oryza brachyantha TaxID=4533 RepID=J3L6N8_ORYBR